MHPPVLLEEEGEEHEQAAVVHDPPDVNVALQQHQSASSSLVRARAGLREVMIFKLHFLNKALSCRRQVAQLVSATVYGVTQPRMFGLIRGWGLPQLGL